MWIPVARTFLMRIRGVAPNSILFDDIDHLSVAFVLPFTFIWQSAETFLR